MKILLKSAKIIDPNSKYHLHTKDIYIENGIIKEIGEIENQEAKIISLPNLHISPGWFDSSISFGEPGYEDRETIENGLKAAAKSGFTSIALNATSKPVTQNQSQVSYLLNKAHNHPVSLYPIGALSIDSKGEHLTELYDMHSEGAIAFYDYKKPLANANLLKLALQYTQAFGGLVQSFPMDKSVAHNGVVNEGKISTLLGLKGIPAFSEELQVARDLMILEYTGGKLHIPSISTAKSVSLIKEAKVKGLQVTCSVSITNLILTDKVLEEFDTYYKLLPPLREESDRLALIKALEDGIIDGVTSDHMPLTIEEKKVEFDHASYGSIGMETAFPVLNKNFGTFNAVQYLQSLKTVFGIESTNIEENQKADLSLFETENEWVFTKNDILSSQNNSALLNQKMKGKVYGIINNGGLLLDEIK